MSILESIKKRIFKSDPVTVTFSAEPSVSPSGRTVKFSASETDDHALHVAQIMHDQAADNGAKCQEKAEFLGYPGKPPIPLGPDTSTPYRALDGLNGAQLAGRGVGNFWQTIHDGAIAQGAKCEAYTARKRAEGKTRFTAPLEDSLAATQALMARMAALTAQDQPTSADFALPTVNLSAGDQLSELTKARVAATGEDYSTAAMNVVRENPGLAQRHQFSMPNPLPGDSRVLFQQQASAQPAATATFQQGDTAEALSNETMAEAQRLSLTLRRLQSTKSVQDFPSAARVAFAEAEAKITALEAQIVQATLQTQTAQLATFAQANTPRSEAQQVIHEKSRQQHADIMSRDGRHDLEMHWPTRVPEYLRDAKSMAKRGDTSVLEGLADAIQGLCQVAKSSLDMTANTSVTNLHTVLRIAEEVKALLAEQPKAKMTALVQNGNPALEKARAVRDTILTNLRGEYHLA